MSKDFKLPEELEVSDYYKIARFDMETVWDTEVRLWGREHTNDKGIIASIMLYDEYMSKIFDYSDGDKFIDIGSHIGTWSLLMASINPTFEIYSYEPLFENFIILKENIKLNGFDGIYPFMLAVSSESEMEETIYYIDGDTDHQKQHRFIGSMKGGTHSIVSRNTISLNDILENNKIERCKVLKIDCEGCEVKAFATITDENIQKIENIVGEFHTFEGVTYDKFVEFFEPYFVDISDDIFGKQPDENIKLFLFRRKDKI